MYHSGKNSGHVSLQGALQLKIVLVTMTFGLNHISWMDSSMPSLQAAGHRGSGARSAPLDQR